MNYDNGLRLVGGVLVASAGVWLTDLAASTLLNQSMLLVHPAQYFLVGAVCVGLAEGSRKLRDNHKK